MEYSSTCWPDKLERTAGSLAPPGGLGAFVPCGTSEPLRKGPNELTSYSFPDVFFSGFGPRSGLRTQARGGTLGFCERLCRQHAVPTATFVNGPTLPEGPPQLE